MSWVCWPAHWFLSELDSCMLFYFTFCYIQYWGAFVGWIVAVRVNGFRFSYMTWKGTRWRSWVWHCATSLKVGVRFPIVSLRCFIDVILPAAQWLWGWLSLQQKWVPGIFPGGWRRPVRRADNRTTFMCRLSWNLGAWTSWKPQGLSRPVLYLFILREGGVKICISFRDLMSWCHCISHFCKYVRDVLLAKPCVPRWPGSRSLLLRKLSKGEFSQKHNLFRTDGIFCNWNCEGDCWLTLSRPMTYIYMSYRSANLQKLHFIYLFHKYTYWIF